jgi:hypothetical protein
MRASMINAHRMDVGVTPPRPVTNERYSTSR